MDTPQLSEIGHLVERSMTRQSNPGTGATTYPHEPTIHVPNVGNALLQAYEQLRIASENIEDHLLFQSAVRRFYARNLSFISQKPPEGLAHELVIELTLAGYLKNNSVSETTARRLTELITNEYASYWDMLRPDDRLKHDIARKWVLESLTVKTEQLFNDPARLLAFADLAYQHFSSRIDAGEWLVAGETVQVIDYPLILYIAIHKALLRSNDANIRNALYHMHTSVIRDPSDLIAFNIKYDTLSNLKTTARISQVIDRHGAPLRILRSGYYDRAGLAASTTLANKDAALELFARIVDEEYGRLRQNMRTGIVKSIVFLLITKAMIGLLIEVPYDLYVTGAIGILALAINLLFPPLFIALTGLTIRIPGSENKQALVNHLLGLLYEPAALQPKLRPPRRAAKSRLFNLLYAFIFLLLFYLVARGLALLGFNVLQGVIFFVFLSTASFLGYRLALQMREFELVPSSEGFLGVLRDTLYAPFVFVGRRISYRFARLNLVAQILDNVIELPLTTVLRLLRQWTAFLRNKQDEIGE